MMKRNNSFEIGILFIVSAISITMLGFLSEEKNLAGHAAANENTGYAVFNDNPLFHNLDSLSELSPGNYIVYDNNLVYSVEDDARLLVGKISHIQDFQKNKYIYVDRDGNVGYVLDLIENGESS